MRTIIRSLVSIVTIAISIVMAITVAGAAPTPMPSPTITPSAAGTGCVDPDSIGLDDAFAHPIDDERTLAFISFVEHLPPNQYGAVIARAKTSPLDDELAEIRKASATGCATSEVVFRAIRLANGVATIWGSDDANVIESSARLALASLLLGDGVSEKTRAARLAVFGTSAAKLDAIVSDAVVPPTPAPNASSGVAPCDAPAVSLITQSPSYPEMAKSGRNSGTIGVRVQLDDHGFVRAITLQSKSLANEFGAQEMVDRTIVAAGATTYRPQFTDCKPLAGSYIFRSNFSSQ